MSWDIEVAVGGAVGVGRVEDGNNPASVLGDVHFVSVLYNIMYFKKIITQFTMYSSNVGSVIVVY